MLALAIVDDIGAIVVIAIFYTDDLDMGYLALALAMLGVVWLASRVGIRSLAFYVPSALIAWYLHARVQASTPPLPESPLVCSLRPSPCTRRENWMEGRADNRPAPRRRWRETVEHLDHEAMLVSEIARESVSPLTRVETRLVGWSSFVVVPLFALANAGVDLRGSSISDAVTSPVGLGVILGLVVGKTVGISLFTLPPSVSASAFFPMVSPDGIWSGWLRLAVSGSPCRLFITGLAFDDPALIDMAKIGVFVGSSDRRPDGSRNSLRGQTGAGGMTEPPQAITA